MKKSISLIASISVILLLNACSSVKVLNSWKADNASTIKDKSLLVIARTDNNAARIAFENEIVDQLTAKGIKATASFTKFPKLNPDEKITDEKAELIKSMLRDAGFNGVVLTVIKDTQELSKTVTESGGYAGGTYYGYYPRYYGGFRGYYYNPMSYSTYGNYVEETSTTYTSKNYILETVIYNLDESEEKQLVAVVTSKIEDPENASKAAKQYVKAITKSFDNK
jgi:hypothetical protein